MTKVKVEYGIFSGKHSGARLHKALRKAGYTVVGRASEADIIVAHSAGCFWLPAAATTKISPIIRNDMSSCYNQSWIRS